MIPVLWFAVSIIAVAGVEWIMLRLQQKNLHLQDRAELDRAAGQAEQLNRSLLEQTQRIQRLEAELSESRKAEQEVRSSSMNTITELKEKLAAVETRNQEQTKQYAEQMRLLTEAKDTLRNEFETLAQRIFEEKGNKFAEQNKANLDLILNPFKEDINSFKLKVESFYASEGKERFSLIKQIEQMQTAYTSLSQEASNLAKALKADTKAQGDWGEMNLKRILEYTGLKENVHYLSQASYKNEDGKQQRPDFIVHLPDNRSIIIDSKVSLVGYDRYYNAADDDERNKGLQDLLKSIRNHIDDLTRKKYDDLAQINTLDFVLMFMPIEASYFVALNNDSSLFSYASGKKVLIVCPSTLLITLQLVESLWRLEDQNKHVLDIADQGSKLYEKFVGFMESMDKVGDHITRTAEAYKNARNQLSEGKGNLVRQAHKLVELGVKAKKRLPERVLSEAGMQLSIEESNEPEALPPAEESQ